MENNKSGIFVDFIVFPGEPSNGGDQGEHCAQILFDNGKWNDYDCYAQMGYICKRSRKLQCIDLLAMKGLRLVVGIIIYTLALYRSLQQ